MGETINWNELFELGENESEPAAPAANNEAQGVKEQEPAAPGIEEGDNLDIPDDSGAKDKPGEPGEPEEPKEPAEPKEEEPPAPPARDREKDAIAAAARRKAEAEKAEALAQAAQEKQQAVDAAYARMNLKNTYTGEPIKTEAEYVAWQQKFQAEQAEAELKKAGLDRKSIDAVIENHPLVQQAKETLTKLEQREEQQRREAAQAAIQAELAEITKMDPTVKSLDDLRAMENYQRFARLVNAGATLPEAYKVVNEDKIIERRAEAAAHSRMKNTAGKEHLAGTEMHSGTMVDVPRDIKQTYREMIPGITDKEMKIKYNQYLAGLKK